MKKVLAWVLALALVLSTFAMSFATYTDEAAQKEANCESQVAVLSALGVVKGYPDGEYKPANVVTRAEMAALVIRAMGFSDVQETGYETGFSDVAKDDWCSGVVKQASDLGLIKGYPDGTFKPSNTVTYNEALTMIVRALGYKEEGLTGTWPQNFVNQAKTLDLYDGVGVTEENFQQGATRGDCAIMIYNALELPMVSYDKNEFLPKDDTFLERLEDLLKKDVELNVKMIVQMCDIAKSDVLGEELLGAPITAMTFDGVVAAVQSVDATLYEAEDLEDYTNFVTAGSWYFYNGYVSEVTGNAAVEPDYVWATIDQKEVTVKSMLTWEANFTFQWSKDYAKKLKDGLYDDFFIQDKNDEIWTDHYFLKGVDGLDKIADGNIVTVYFADPTYAVEKTTRRGNVYLDVDDVHKDAISKIEVGTKTVAGHVDKVKSDSRVATIEGNDYNIANDGWKLDEFDEPDVLANQNGIAYLNYRGDIAFWEKDSDKVFYGITTKKISTEYKENGQTKRAYTLDVFTQDGEGVTLDVVKGSNAQDAIERSNFKEDGLAAYTLSDEDLNNLVYRYYHIDGGDSSAVANTTTKIAEGQLIQGKYNKNGDANYRNCARFVLSNDVVVFSKDSFGPDAEWTVSDYDSIENFEFDPNADVQWITDGDKVVALAYSQCLTDENATFAFITDIEQVKTDSLALEGNYEVTFINLGTKNTVTMTGVGVSAFLDGIPDEDDLVYITFDGDKVKTIEDAVDAGAIGSELTGNQVVEIDINGASIDGNYVKKSAQQQYRIAENALVYKWNGTELSPVSLDDIYDNSNFTLYQTVSGAWTVDIVIWNYPALS